MKLFLLIIFIGSSAVAHLNAADAASAAVQLVDKFNHAQYFWQQLEAGKEILSAHNTNTLSLLVDGLTNEDRHARGNVAFVFAGLGDERGFETLSNSLVDKSSRPKTENVNGNWTLRAQIRTDRYYAVHLFGDLKDPRAVPILIPLLNDEDVSYIVPWSLGQIGDARAIAPLINQLNQKDPSLRVLAMDALAQLGAAEALPRLRALSASNEKSNFGDLISVGEAANAAISKITASKVLDGKGPDWVASCLKDFATIKPGMPRRHVEDAFLKDGGIHSISTIRFAHPTCRYFKIDVEFNCKKDAADQNRPIASGDDPVIRVSKPYLETPFTD
jgi:HEAT repeat protein